MKFTIAPRPSAPHPTGPARSRVERHLRTALTRVVEIGRRIDEDRAVRDRTNHSSGTVDGSFWIYLR